MVSNSPKVRDAVRAGSWYQGTQEGLKKEIDQFYHYKNVGPGKIPALGNKNQLLGVISPHAGYACSAPIAAHSYAVVLQNYVKLDTVVIFGPNHTGLGPPISIYPKGRWKTPLGTVDIDDELAAQILAGTKEVSLDNRVAYDESAHAREHSIEIQLPFLQYSYNDFKIVPICLSDQSESSMTKMGDILVNVIKNNSNKRILVVVSTDFNHYEQHDETTSKDLALIDAILQLDITRMYSIREKKDISACGYGGIAVIMRIAKILGYNKVTLLKHATSGDTCSDRHQTVGYAAISFEK